MSLNENGQHVVFGVGQVGRALTARLAGLGLAVRVVSRRRPLDLADGVDWRGADAADPEAATDAAKGATVIYQCLNAPYTKWAERFPPLQRGVLTAAERNGALLVSLENLYGYGPTHGKSMTEDLPLAATTVKGRTRAAMTEELLAARDAGRSPHRYRAGIGFLRCRRDRIDARANASSRTLWRGDGPTSLATPIWPTPTATCPTSRPVWPSWAPTSVPSTKCGISQGPRL